MHILQVFNRQRSTFGGEGAVIRDIENGLTARGHTTTSFFRSSERIANRPSRKVGTALSGIYNLRIRRELERVIRSERADIVHMHNVYPQLSPSVFDACRRAGVPSIMTVHSHILTCPNWYHVRNGSFCDLCLGGHEYRCLAVNCRGNLLESGAYALRSYAAARLGIFKRATLLIAVSQYLREHLATAGFRRDRLVVIPNAVPIPSESVDPTIGTYAVFAGRLSHEKGVAILLEAVRTTGIPVKIAGDGPLRAALETAAPENVNFLGRLDPRELAALYRGARLAVVPSIARETFGIAAAEAMAHGLPVVVTSGGALPELAEDDVCGAVVPPNDIFALRTTLVTLWKDPATLRRLGAAGRARVQARCTQARFIDQILAAYLQAFSLHAIDNAGT